jgi:hypothetical protein
LTGYEVLYAFTGSYIILAGLAMIVVYSITNPWWRNHYGRMLITYAVAEILMSALLMAAVIAHMNPWWFRYTWSGLQVVVGSVLCYQTAAIIRLHRKREQS